jgi:DNA-directed RNA polymerase specialized sigma subunit
MNRLPEHEQKTLRLFYLEEKSLKEIAEIMGFSDEVSARVQKFKYVRHLRKLIREDPDYE